MMRNFSMAVLIIVVLAFSACTATDKTTASVPVPSATTSPNGNIKPHAQPKPTPPDPKLATLAPDQPTCELLSDMTVDISWTTAPGASEYVVYWSPQRNVPKAKGNSARTSTTSFNSKLRRGEYGAKLPMYYRVAAVREGVESNLSETCLAQLRPHKGGKFCQICGERAVGYCHLRNIYVCSTHNTFSADDGTNWQCP